MSGVSQPAPGRSDHPLLAAPGRATVVTVITVALTAAVFTAVGNHGMLAGIQHLDDAWLRLMVSGRSPPLTVVAKIFNILGLVYVTLPVRIAVAGFLAVRRRWWHLAAFAAAVATSEVLIGLLKGIYGRPRPPGSLVATSGTSFPSGHAIAATVTVMAAVFALIPPGRLRTRLAVAAAAFSILMGLSRAYLGAHWLSDAVAGILLGTSCALVTALVVDRAGMPRSAGGPEPGTAPGRWRPPSSRYRRPGDVIRVIAAGLVLIVAVAVTVLVNSPRLGLGGWLPGWRPADAAFPWPPLLAGAVAVAVAASPWLSRPWRHAAWIALGAGTAAGLAGGAILPTELVLAVAAGVAAGAGALVAFGVADRRLGPDEIAAQLRSAGLQVRSVAPARVDTKGSRPFTAVTDDGRPLFIKAIGAEHRDADLLYRAYRLARLRNVGDRRPAASLIQGVEHQALAALMAERAGVRVPHVERMVRAADGTMLLAMERVDGSALGQLPGERISDDLLRQLWAEVNVLHAAGIAHRSLRAANVMVGEDGRPWLTDFSFAELAATQRQQDLDLAELLASLAILVGAETAVASAVAVIGAERLAAAIPLLQPLALSAATRRAIAQDKGLLAATRSAAAEATGGATTELARIRRVRPRTLLTIAAAAGAFYFILPQLAQVGSSWHAIQSAHWAWLPVVIAMSALTYLASAVSLLGGIPGRLPFWPTVATQAASSFVNRISPANVGGMALNARYLQKSGVDPAAGVAAVGLSALAGAIVHLILLVSFFIWASHGAAQPFKLPSASKLLLVLAAAAALAGLILATRRGRRFAVTRLRSGLRSASASLARVAASPVKLAMLFGGSALVTLAYVGGLAASVHALGGTIGLAQIGAVYMAASAVAAASPTPGGLGAIEAALVAGLTGVGLSAGVAVPAVLAYRLATYWLPVAPGWIALTVLQRRDYI